MQAWIEALSQHAFMQTAVAAALLASIGCGVMGTYVVVKRIAFLAGGIAHSVLGGMGAAAYFGLDPLHGALPAAVAAALLIGWVRLHWRAQEDTLISALWAIGMAIGVLFITKAPGYQDDLMSDLFGNILLVPRESLWLMAALDALLLAVVAVYRGSWWAASPAIGPIVCPWRMGCRYGSNGPLIEASCHRPSPASDNPPQSPRCPSPKCPSPKCPSPRCPSD